MTYQCHAEHDRQLHRKSEAQVDIQLNDTEHIVYIWSMREC